MRKLGVSLVLSSVLLVAACSDEDNNSSDDGGGGGSSISKEDFVEQANARCAEYNAMLDTEGANVTQEGALEFVTETLLPGLQATIDDIRALGFPQADAEMLDGLMDESEAAIEEIQADPASALAQTESPFASINARLVEYGLTECGAG